MRRIDFCYTPKHGSWLNVAECELSCLTSQCLTDRRIGDLADAAIRNRHLVRQHEREATRRRLAIQIDNARAKLKRLYPKI